DRLWRSRWRFDGDSARCVPDARAHPGPGHADQASRFDLSDRLEPDARPCHRRHNLSRLQPLARAGVAHPPEILLPVIIALVFVAAFEGEHDWGDLYSLLFFGVVGWIMKRLGWPRPPMVLGLVAGAIFEGDDLVDRMATRRQARAAHRVRHGAHRRRAQ